MKPLYQSAMKIALLRKVNAVLVLIGFIVSQKGACAGEPQLPLLTTAAEVRNLTPAQADLHYPVKLRGVVTFYDDALFSRFIQDETAGIYLRETNVPALSSGQLVEVEGYTGSGEYAPVIFPTVVNIVGQKKLPAPRPVIYEQLASGKEDSQFVEVSGIVRSVSYQETSKYHIIELAAGGGRLTVYAHGLRNFPANDLVDSTVRISGVCSSQFNRQRQLFAIRLMMPRAEDMVVEIPAVAEPFSIPTQTIRSLFQFAPQDAYGHRVKVEGIVTFFHPGSSLYIKNENQGLFVKTKSSSPLQLGDRVEVLGFATPGQYTPALQDATYRKIGLGETPTPIAINHDIALRGDFDCRLVQIEATLINHAKNDLEQPLVLESGGFIFHAYLEGNNTNAYNQLENGSRLAITGICLVEPGVWQAGDTWRAKSFRILLRSEEDIRVLRAPPWWTLQKMLWIAAALIVLVIAAFTWIVGLRRRVEQQTGIIRHQLQVEAQLKERYLDLFENANDMVFTHDLNGKITAINRVGERLLQRGREQLISMKLLDLIAEDQRAAAGQWLNQVAEGVETHSGDWDFLNAAGQRIKLDISSRLIDVEGKAKEIEGIARDVTERKRLEKEILEVSNREQRRIGHDLHDGVCQQLAATNYLIDVLADQLQEKNYPEAAEAERIGKLINETITQTRLVARGLFPVKLDESGIASALEELATNTASLFKVDCRFQCQAPLPELDNSIALHLYYIAQESTLNAAKHGQAKHINISLTLANNLLTLSVEDDGIGITPSVIAKMSGMGIRIMRYRARVIGGTLDLKKRPHHGTQVRCELYLPPASK